MVFVCGTNAFNPMCRYYWVSALNNMPLICYCIGLQSSCVVMVKLFGACVCLQNASFLEYYGILDKNA